MRGEFIRGDGLVIPNNITLIGGQDLLQSMARHDNLSFWLGLVDGFPSKAGVHADLLEPVIGTGGYARQQLLQNSTDWPNVGALGNEAYVESKVVTFAAGAYSRSVSRIMLANSQNGLSGWYFSLSTSFPDLQITADTPLPSRQFKYRLYWA